MPNHLVNLAGAQLNRITVIRQAPRRDGRTYWVCVCECDPDRELTIRADVLTRQQGIRNCGCWKREKAAALARKPDNEIGYLAAHDRVRRARGRAPLHLCVTCGRTATNWAYRKDAQQRRAEASGPFVGRPFSPDPDDYQPMCQSCHTSYDRDVPWRPLPRVVRAIRQKILDGAWPAGARVPPTTEIASSYGVGRTTVYRAFAALAETGLLERAEGRYVVTSTDGWWTFHGTTGGTP